MTQTMYENLETGELTVSHSEAMGWFRSGVDVYAFRESNNRIDPNGNGFIVGVTWDASAFRQ